MNIYDKVHELAAELRNCDEVKKLREAAEKIKGNDSNKKMLEDFRQMQFQAYSEQVEKGEISKDTMEKLQNLGSVVSMNPSIGEYLQAEARFGTLWEDVIKILNEAVGVDISFDEKK